MLEIGSVLQGRYRIERLVGQGGMGTVYLATEEQLGKRVAIKAMTIHISDPGERERALRTFQNEARILASLDHPGLVDVTHYFTEGDQQYLVMSFVDGTTLEAKVRDTEGFLPVSTSLEWMDEVMGILEYLHGRQPPVVVRDLKPANIMLDAYERVRLIDFGIARCLDAKETTTFTGTPGYASLEQFGGTTDPRADTYAAGATLYNLLTGKTPPASIDLILQTASLDPPSFLNPAVSNALNEVVLKMMALQKEDRYQTVREARQALRGVQSAAEPSTSPRRARFCPECGSPMTPLEAGCPHCGAKVEVPAAPGPVVAPPLAPPAPSREGQRVPLARSGGRETDEDTSQVIGLRRGLTQPRVVAPPRPKSPPPTPVPEHFPPPPRPAVAGSRGGHELELVPGASVDSRFLLDKPLGDRCWLAHLINLPTERVVLQVWASGLDAAAGAAFRQELSRVPALEHPQVAEVMDALVVGGKGMVVTEYVEGVSLDQLLVRLGGFLPVPLALGLVQQLFDTLGYLHGQGVVLGDLRPGHVLVTAGGQCKVIDLGIGLKALAAATGSAQPPAGHSQGFAAPERYRPGAQPDVAGDLYALGAVTYAIFTRQTPPPGPRLATGDAMLASPELLNPEVPPRLRVLVSRLMHAQPAERFTSVADARKCLDWAFEPVRKVEEAPGARPCPRCGQELPAGQTACPRCEAPPAPAAPRERIASGGAERPEPPFRPRVASSGVEKAPGPPPPRKPVSLDTDGGSGPVPLPVVSKAPVVAPKALPVPPKAPPIAAKRPPMLAPRRSAVGDSTSPAAPTPAAVDLNLEGLNIEASVAAGGGNTFQKVRVEEFSLRSVVFASTYSYRVRSNLSIRVTVSSPTQTKPIVFTVQMVIRQVAPEGPGVWLYAGALRALPPSVRAELESASMAGRRRARRLREFFQVTCTDPVFRALGTDISATGIGIAAPEDLPAGRVVELILDLTDDPAARSLQLTVLARVKHSVQRDDGRFEIGLEFTGMSAAATSILQRYLKS